MSEHSHHPRRHRSSSRDRTRSHRSHRSHRSRSPSHHDDKERSRRHRSRSPKHRHHHPRTHRISKRTRSPPPDITLPLNSPPISTRHFTTLTPVFASYLSIQKNLTFSDLDHAEAKGRFKSFVRHYNRGELARGWYERVVALFRDGPPAAEEAAVDVREPPPKRLRVEKENDDVDEDSSDDEFGPAPPGQEKRRNRLGPKVPGVDELEIQKELHQEDRVRSLEDLRYERRLDRKSQKEALEELVPRAEPGTRERMLEKKKEAAEAMRGFREKSPGGEVDEGTLMGGGEGETLAQKKAAMERKKNDREIRREQMLQARIAEREERVQGMKEKEEKTMAMLKSLAQSRFG